MTPGKDTDSAGRWRALLASERDAAVLYSRLADAETGERQQIGATIGAVNGRSVLRSGLRQVVAGALAAGITFGVGHLIGTS